MKLNLFGKQIAVIRSGEEWVVYMLGEGKKRNSNITIPPDLPINEILRYLADLYHETASEDFPDVLLVEE